MIKITQPLTPSGFILDMSLPINDLEQIAAEKALEQATKGKSVQESSQFFFAILQFYGVPYYKYNDLMKLYLYPYLGF